MTRRPIGARPAAPAHDEPPAATIEFPREFSVGAQLRRMYRLFERDLTMLLAPEGIPVSMWFFLRALWEEDGITQRELSDRAGVTAQSAVEQLRNMEARGLIRRERSPHDRRKVFVYLTSEGDRLRKLLPYAVEINAIALKGLSDGEIGFLRLVLERMNDNFRRRWEAYDEERAGAE